MADNNRKNRNALCAKRTVDALKRHQFDAYFCETAEEAVEKVLELIPQEDVVSWGGSVTVDDLGIKTKLAERGQKMIDRDTAKTPEERKELMRKALTCDTFLMSSNAISEDGQLVNIDGGGNRVAALCFGPKSVIVVAGMNKVVSTIDAAYDRARNVAAPINHQRFQNLQTPCMVTGSCADCINGSICSQIVRTRFSMVPSRIKVVLVNDDFGY